MSSQQIVALSIERFERMLFREIGDRELVSRMLKVYEQYLFCVGMFDGEWNEYFSSEKEFHEFISRYHFYQFKDMQDMDFFDRSILSYILVDSLDLSGELVDTFLLQEFNFFVECGLLIPEGEGYIVCNPSGTVGIIFFRLNKNSSYIYPYRRAVLCVDLHDNIPLSCLRS